MKDFIVEYQLSDLTICDRMLDLFRLANERGLTSAGVTGVDDQVRPEYKDSTEFYLGDAGPLGKPEQFKYPEYHKELSGFIDNYCADAKLYEYVGKFTMQRLPQIQWYKPGAGYHSWHIDGGHELCDRAITFLTYLNTVPNGGTEFMHQERIIEAVKGKTVIFPAGYTHIHRGQISANLDKYILTGWIWWDNRR
jgi:2OG-Fe(II) oxygenase superfamily